MRIDELFQQIPVKLGSVETLLSVVDTAVEDEPFMKESYKGTLLIQPPGQFWSREVVVPFNRELMEDKANPLSNIPEVQRLLTLPDSSEPELVLYEHRSMTKGFPHEGFGTLVWVPGKILGVIPTRKPYCSLDSRGIQVRARYALDERARTLDLPYWDVRLYRFTSGSFGDTVSTSLESRTYHDYPKNGGGFFTGSAQSMRGTDEIVDGFAWLLSQLRQN